MAESLLTQFQVLLLLLDWLKMNSRNLRAWWCVLHMQGRMLSPLLLGGLPSIHAPFFTQLRMRTGLLAGSQPVSESLTGVPEHGSNSRYVKTAADTAAALSPISSVAAVPPTHQRYTAPKVIKGSLLSSFLI